MDVDEARIKERSMWDRLKKTMQYQIWNSNKNENTKSIMKSTIEWREWAASYNDLQSCISIMEKSEPTGV